MIRLRQLLVQGLRHPVLGPVILVLLGLILAFVVLHTVEHGAQGLLFSCVLFAVAAVRLIVVTGRTWRLRDEVPPARRGPPRPVRRVLPASRSAAPAFVLPLRL